MKNIVILSGGSGNTALLKGLYSSDEVYNINIIVNMSDNGKSTGICREITNTLGVSDVRKNHYKVFKNSPKYKNIDKEYADAIHDLFEGRHDINTTDELIKVRDILDKAEFSWAKIYVDRFFNRIESEFYEFNNFNIMNIVYSQMYTEFGYEETHRRICGALGIPNNVIVNSFDNIKLLAQTESGHVILDEGDIVEWCNSDDKIVRNLYVGHSIRGLNPEAIKLINEADVIIISSGTFWSSIYPTLDYLGFYEYINNSKAKKYFIMNTKEDKDAYGVTSLEFILHLLKMGLDMNDFTVIENKNAVETLKIPTLPSIKVIEEELGNDNGKHDPEKLVKVIEDTFK